MPRIFFALTVMLATAAPLFAQAPVSTDAVLVGGRVIVLVDCPLPAPGHFIWEVERAFAGPYTLHRFQFAPQMQSQTAFLRVFLPDDTFGISSPEPVTTAPIPDLTGWRMSLAMLGKAPKKEPSDPRYYEKPNYHEDLRIRGDPSESQVFNIAIGTKF